MKTSEVKQGKTKITLISCYEIMQNWKPKTYRTPQTVTKITTGKISHYIIPFGEDYECEGGHHCEILSEEEFTNNYSTIFIG